MARLLNYQNEDPKGLHPLELPIITKVYDFNPDYPSLQNCLLDVESYRRIIGMFDKDKTPQATFTNFHGYDSDYGKLSRSLDQSFNSFIGLTIFRSH